MNEEQYAIMNTHAWEAGMMHVHPEDLAAGEYSGRKVECSRCEDIHPSSRPCPNASAVTLELWGFASEPVCQICGGNDVKCQTGFGCAYYD